MLEVVGADVEDWQIVLVVWRLFGVLVRESRCWRWLESTWRMDKTCWLCSDFSACWCGKINIEVGCFIVGTCVVPWSVMVGLGRLFAATVSTVPGHRARPLARRWLRQWLRYRRCYEW